MADHVIIGSAINGLIAASLLALKGDRVLVPERAATHPGGCLRTEDPAPGYQHDVTAPTFLLFMTSPARAALGPHLVRHGFDYCHSPHPTAVLRPDGQAVVMAMDGAAIDTDSIGADPPFLCALLGQRLRSWPAAKLLFGQARKRGLRGLAGWFGPALDPARGWLEAIYRSRAMQALLAPWVLHTGLTVESAYSGQMGRVTAFSPEVAGAPILKGGAGQAAQAFQALISENGGKARCNSDVDRIIVRNGKVASVRLADGEDIATTSVLASVAPGQLYDRLMQGVTLPDDRLALIHLSDGIDSVLKSSNEAAGEIEGTDWDDVRAAVVERLERILSRHIKGLVRMMVARKTHCPKNLVRMNINLGDGDASGGYCGIDPFFPWRPFAHSRNGDVPARRLIHTGASTHPGPGLGGGSGFNAVKRLGA